MSLLWSWPQHTAQANTLQMQSCEQKAMSTCEGPSWCQMRRAAERRRRKVAEGPLCRSRVSAPGERPCEPPTSPAAAVRPLPQKQTEIREQTDTIQQEQKRLSGRNSQTETAKQGFERTLQGPLPRVPEHTLRSEAAGASRTDHRPGHKRVPINLKGTHGGRKLEVSHREKFRMLAQMWKSNPRSRQRLRQEEITRAAGRKRLTQAQGTLRGERPTLDAHGTEKAADPSPGTGTALTQGRESAPRRRPKGPGGSP